MALALLTAGAMATHAAPLTRTSNDLFIGFRALSGTTGDDKTYLLNIGQFSKFSTTSFSLNNVNTQGLNNFASDLAAQYGSNWLTSGNVLWGIFGANTTSTNPPLYASEFRPSATVQSTPWSTQPPDVRTNIRTNIADGLSGYAGGTSTANSNLGFFQSATLTNGYFQQVTFAGPDFKESDWTSIESLTSNSLDLWRINGTDVVSPGYFTIDSLNNIVYSAVPEPSTYALFGLGLLAFVLARRRKNENTSVSRLTP